jgi:hypothetical protein
MEDVHFDLRNVSRAKSFHNSKKCLELNAVRVWMMPADPFVAQKYDVGVNWKIDPSDELASPQQLLVCFDTIMARLLPSVQSFKLIKWYEIHWKLHISCGGDSSVQRNLLSLFSLLYDSLQSTSKLRKGVAVVNRGLAKVVLDCGIRTAFKKKIRDIDIASVNCVVQSCGSRILRYKSYKCRAMA